MPALLCDLARDKIQDGQGDKPDGVPPMERPPAAAAVYLLFFHCIIRCGSKVVNGKLLQEAENLFVDAGLLYNVVKKTVRGCQV